MCKNGFIKSLKSEFVRNSAVLVSGNAAGQVIALFIYPLLSRLYTKEDFGIFALFTSLTGVLSILATCKYEEAFVMTSSRKESSALLGFTFRILLLFCVALLLIVWIGGPACLSFFKMDSITGYRYWIPFFILFSGLFTLMTNLANKEKRYKTIAASNLSVNIYTSALKIGLKYLSKGASGLITGQVIGQFLACFSFRKLNSNIREAIYCSWQEKKATALKYLSFPKYNMPRGFIGSFSFNLPFFLLTSTFGEAKLGLFFMALSVSFRPINLISNSIYQVFYEKSASLKENQQKISTGLNQFQKYCLICGLPLFVLIYLLSNILFKYIFGSEFEESGTYLRYVLPWMFMSLLTAPMGFLPFLFHKQGTFMALEIVHFVARWLVLYLGIYYHNFDLAIILFGIVGTIFLLITWGWYRHMISKYEKTII